MPAYRPLEERFWEKVDIRGEDECWPWTGALVKEGYGRVRLPRQRKTDYAHRVAYRLVKGEIPDGLMVCHRCGNPPCANPGHLYAGTGTDNNLDRTRHGRYAGGANGGSRHHMAKLTDEQVAEIRRRLSAGVTGRALAKEFPISETQMSRIRRGESWPA